MSFQLTKEEIIMQLAQVLREDNDLIESLYEEKLGGTVYYVGNDTFVIEDDEDDEEEMTNDEWGSENSDW